MVLKRSLVSSWAEILRCFKVTLKLLKIAAPLVMTPGICTTSSRIPLNADLATEQSTRLEKMIKAYASYAEEHRVLSVADGYDQRQQVGANAVQKRLLELLPFILGAIVLLFVGIRLLRRRSKAGG